MGLQMRSNPSPVLFFNQNPYAISTSFPSFSSSFYLNMASPDDEDEDEDFEDEDEDEDLDDEDEEEDFDDEDLDDEDDEE